MNTLARLNFCDALIPELMRSGFDYGDSANQYCIASRELPALEEHSELMTVFSTASPYAKNYLAFNANEFFAALDALLSHAPDATANQQRIKTYPTQNDLIIILILLFKMGLLSQVYLNLILNHPPSGMLQIVSAFYKPNLYESAFAQEIFQCLLDNPSSAGALAISLDILSKFDLLQGDIGLTNRNALIQHQKLFSISESLEILQDSDLLLGEDAQANFDLIISHQHPREVTKSLQILHRTGLLSENREAVFAHPSPERLATALQLLHVAGLLTENREAVIMHPSPERLATALQILHGADLLTLNREYVLTHLSPDDLAIALQSFNELGLLPVNHSALLTHPHPALIPDAMRSLRNARLLSKTNIDAVLAHPNLSRVCNALKILNLYGDTRDQTNLSAIIEHQHPCKVAKAINILHEAAALDEHREVISKHPSPDEAASILVSIYQIGLLTKECVDAVLGHECLGSLQYELKISAELGLFRQADAQANLVVLLNCQSPLRIGEVLKVLSDSSLLSPENRIAVTRHPSPAELARVLVILQKSGLLSGDSAQEYFNALQAHTSLNYLTIYALEGLFKSNLLQGEYAKSNFHATLRSPSLINDLIVKGLLSGECAQGNLDSIIKHHNSTEAISLLELIQKIGLLSGTNASGNRDALLNHSFASVIAEVFKLLAERGLLNQSIVNTLLRMKEPCWVMGGIERLKTANLLDSEGAEENLNIVLNHTQPSLAAQLLISLKNIGLLNREKAATNRAALSACRCLRYFYFVINSCHEKGLFDGADNQEIFDSILRCQDFEKLYSAIDLMDGDQRIINFKALLNHSHTINLLLDLQAKMPRLFSSDDRQAVFDGIISCGNDILIKLQNAIEFLQNVWLLNPDNLKKLLKHKNKIAAINVLLFIHHTGKPSLLRGLDKQSNFDAVISHSHLDYLESNLKKSSSITQDQFTMLLTQEAPKNIYSIFGFKTAASGAHEETSSSSACAIS